MKLTPPAFATWFIALLMGSAGIAARLGYLPAVAPHAFWLVAIAFVMLVLGSLLRGL